MSPHLTSHTCDPCSRVGSRTGTPPLGSWSLLHRSNSPPTSRCVASTRDWRRSSESSILSSSSIIMGLPLYQHKSVCFSEVDRSPVRASRSTHVSWIVRSGRPWTCGTSGQGKLAPPLVVIGSGPRNVLASVVRRDPRYRGSSTHQGTRLFWREEGDRPLVSSVSGPRHRCRCVPTNTCT